jgi:hypothetical protein
LFFSQSPEAKLQMIFFAKAVKIVFKNILKNNKRNNKPADNDLRNLQYQCF